MAYEPDLETFCDILRDYSRHGLTYFKTHSTALQGMLRASLGGHIEDNDDRIERKLATLKKGGQADLSFLPMPKPSGKEIKAGFFLPRIVPGDEGKYQCSFEIIFWIERDRGKTFGMRFEPAGENPSDSHCYPHVQLTRQFDPPTVTTHLESWMPTSYPAIPLGYKHPLQLFLGMAVALHGYSANGKEEYARAVIIDAMRRGQAALRAKQILEEVKRMLG
ncbi:hypothetical protein JQ616_06545 [Bradyrhizobium tropiciagri]|uniref:hypothetical protein n=1 Tax=Bradyrhizobium tropiciagri TaxID=312253 RepID=UPI001BA66348|nr:hypothetical protein [Bradyrhizobium tropiciagri]MBR0894600.1 hypothetical protein [Bradyrhizobium tropiciagri]